MAKTENSPLPDDTNPLIQYANAVHDFGVFSPEALEIKMAHVLDETFQRRADVLAELIENKEANLTELGAMDFWDKVMGPDYPRSKRPQEDDS